ncbi:putative DDE superfamily endonuclease domain-containing protein 68 [Homarus americanus]|uniref:Putative DDE superfamily endonuclease domain-containing protein 68 n=1 Tax=Homarus americanus TaxID=6706 RepID=A0A8J5K1P1_HOMAM|nr:putative DDE superfamily endonuclease domain-containing protein 68 [Homarus americanus]
MKAACVAFAQYMYEDGIHKQRVYVDEAGYNLYTYRTYGRVPRGQFVNRIVVGQLGSNVTLIVAISNLAGLFHYEIHITSVTKEVFKNFMTSLDSVLGPEAAVILMDNAPCPAGIEQEFEDRVIKNLPPHSPFLNPI